MANFTVSYFLLRRYPHVGPITVSLSSCLTLCGNYIGCWYCVIYASVSLTCSASDTRGNNIWGLVSTALSILVPLTPSCVIHHFSSFFFRFLDLLCG